MWNERGVVEGILGDSWRKYGIETKTELKLKLGAKI